METKKTFITKTREETLRYAQRLGELIESPVTILMYGDLGAGKTTFTQGLAKGLGVARNITSPTFTILKIYKGRLPLYHIDAYRLEGLSQDLGFEEYLYESDGVTVVEWPMFVEDLLPEHAVKLNITTNENGERVFTAEAAGRKEEKILEDWLS